ncbi:MAG: efflux RND transporter permease subunit [Acidobacteriota bacterium]
MIKVGPSGSLAHYFIKNKLTLLIVLTSLFLGVFAVLMTPREEEPQIVVPMVDIIVPYPGASPEEVESRVSTPLEKLFWEIPKVEYVYSTSSSNFGMIIVRFLVNSDETEAMVRIYDKLNGNKDKLPKGALEPIIKLHSIDDVPVLALTLWGEKADSYTLTRLAQEIEIKLREVQDVSQVEVIGSQKREISVVLDSAKLASYSLSPIAIAQSLSAFNSRMPAGTIVGKSEEIKVEAGSWLKNSEDVSSVLVGIYGGKPVYHGDVAVVKDSPPVPSNYVFLGLGSSASEKELKGDKSFYPAVTISVSKRKGVNATALNQKLLEKIEAMKGKIIPKDINVTVTRDYGETAKEKSNELIEHLLLATISVVILIAFMLGFKESLVVGIAVPVTLSFTLLTYFLAGYTLNRVTLFALIFSIGILVDDAIVVVENIYRHFTMKDSRTIMRKAIEAVDEVGNPTILATFTVIAAILPMAFVRGMMGPYMRPIPVGASVAMIISLLVAFIVSPWASFALLKNKKHLGEEKEMSLLKHYRNFMSKLLSSKKVMAYFLIGNLLLLVISIGLVLIKFVKVKMLPFDNKSEIQVVLDMNEGTTLEDTLKAAMALSSKIRDMEGVTDFEIYAGTSAPITFNGLVRHYFLRQSSNKADIQVNLLPKGKRSKQSHEIAKELRTLLEPTAKEYGVKLKIVEIPPGPPVISTLVAEIYGPNLDKTMALGQKVLNLFKNTESVVDSDIFMLAPQKQLSIEVDPKKAASLGISTMEISNALALVLGEFPADYAHFENERESVPIKLKFSNWSKSSPEAISSIMIPSRTGAMVPLSQTATFKIEPVKQDIYHKNLKRVVYVIGEVAGKEESPVYAMMKLNRELKKIETPDGEIGLERLYTSMPFLSDKYSMKWDGEWQITYEVFRDLGISFALVLVLMYILVVGWFKSYLTPLAIMAPIPLSLVGIIPAHGIFGVFFTATSMIGFIALAGVVVRNSILVIDFAEMRMRQGLSVKEALIEGGAVRFRPMLLTALAVVVGSSVMLLDPIFQGMALALISGEVASTLLSWGAIPVLYYLFYGDTPPVKDEPFQEEE